METTNQIHFLSILRQLTDDRKADSENVYNFLSRNTDFFSAPASTKYHGAFNGGLVLHSINVYENIMKLYQLYQDKINIPKDSFIIAALLHIADLTATYLGEEF